MDNQRPNLRGVNGLDEIAEARLWKTLDSISERLTGIEAKLSEVVRLEERVNNHDETLARFGNRLDNHDSRIRQSELWQANQGDRDSVERLITNVQKDVSSIREDVEDIEDKINISKGHKDVFKEILKWVSGILAAVLIFKLTGK